MKIELYPTFDEVFYDQQLKGIFYPLCSIELDDAQKTKLFFVSSNGIWMNESETSDFNNSAFTKFDIVDSKYKFNGNLDLYQGHQKAKDFFILMEMDFEENGKSYLENKVSTASYIANIKPKLADFEESELDVEYYLQTFYEYAITKLNYSINTNFGSFNSIMKNWNSAKNSSSVVYAISSENSSGFADIEANAEYFFPKSIGFSDYEKIGQTIGHEFFTDGTDCILLYNQNNKTVLCINNYS